MFMKKFDLLKKAGKDLQIGLTCLKGQKISVKNCWHFSTDGNAVDALFLDDEDFRWAMNRIYVLYQHYNVLILAFVLMDTHIHFVLYGDFDECNRFVHEYVRLSSMAIATKYGDRHKLKRIQISHQMITDDVYLKTCICYVVKNPPVGGIMHNFYDYPWGSGSLYFRKNDNWTAPKWTMGMDEVDESLSSRDEKALLRSHKHLNEAVPVIDGLIFPGEYVAVDLVERLFRTCKSFMFFTCTTKEMDIESRAGLISRLSIPMQEMRQHKAELCRKMFGTDSTRSLDTTRRLILAKTLKSRYNSSSKQIARLCGLVYEDVKELLG